VARWSSALGEAPREGEGDIGQGPFILIAKFCFSILYVVVLIGKTKIAPGQRIAIIALFLVFLLAQTKIYGRAFTIASIAVCLQVRFQLFLPQIALLLYFQPRGHRSKDGREFLGNSLLLLQPEQHHHQQWIKILLQLLVPAFLPLEQPESVLHHCISPILEEPRDSHPMRPESPVQLQEKSVIIRRPFTPVERG
jgi:hypothetical protein